MARKRKKKAKKRRSTGRKRGRRKARRRNPRRTVRKKATRRRGRRATTKKRRRRRNPSIWKARMKKSGNIVYGIVAKNAIMRGTGTQMPTGPTAPKTTRARPTRTRRRRATRARTTTRRRRAAVPRGKKKKAPKKGKGKWISPKRAQRARRSGTRVGKKVKVTLRSGMPMSKKRRAAHIARGRLSASGMVNPRRRRRRRKNPPTPVETFRRTLASLNNWKTAGHGILGMSAATVFPSLLAEVTKGKVQNTGPMGVVLSALSTVAATYLANWIERLTFRPGKGVPAPLVGLSSGVMQGGMIATAIRLLFEVSPAAANYLKLSPVRTPVYGIGAGAQKGMADWMELRGMGLHGGLGYIGPNVNEALIAGESFAQSVGQFHGGGMGDFLELKGMGNNRIPMQDIMGPGQMLGMGQGYPGQYGAGTYDPYHTRSGPLSGMGDWVQFVPGTAPADQAFVPAMETF